MVALIAGKMCYLSLFPVMLLILRCSGGDVPAGQVEVRLPMKNVTKISFGSCNREWAPQPLWEVVEAQRPDMFLWLGDVVYADTRAMPLVWRPSPLPVMREKYQQQLKHPQYSKFLSSGIPVYGIWDDHDYGLNDGGNTYADAAESQKLFLEFIKEPQDSIRRRRPGLYTSYLLSASQGRKVKLILVDVRSQLNLTTRDVLGAEQWAWLEEQLTAASTEADLTIVTSGMQVLSNLPTVDRMQRYGKSRERFLELVSRFPKVVLLSGDVHFAEVNCWKPKADRYAVHELTSSGLTHVCLSWGIQPFDYLCKLTLKLILQSGYRVSKQTVAENFATIEFNWQENNAGIVFNVHTVHGTDLTYTVSLDALSSTGAECPPVVSRPKPLYVFWICAGTGTIVTVLLLRRILQVLLGWVASLGSPARRSSPKSAKKRE